MFLERANMSFRSVAKDGLVIVAKPGGGHQENENFIANCLEVLEAGTQYLKFHNIALPVLTVNSRHIRLVQLADIVTSCTLARISGEKRYSPPIFDFIKPLFRKELDLIGGVGLKIHPDFRYANLYYWLLGDTHVRRYNVGIPLPLEGHLYFDDPGI
jgi:hypothetical protein